MGLNELRIGPNAGRVMESFYHSLGHSGHMYSFPVTLPDGSPRTYAEMGFTSPTHKDRFLHAVDIPVDDPRIKPQPIFAPQSGKIISLKQEGVLWGNGPEFNPYLNHLTVQVSDAEFYEFCHIGENSCPFGLGDWVSEGQPLAMTGLNGYITANEEGEPDSHVHILVAKFVQAPQGFDSVKIRWEE